jgi:sodium/proline symporter
MMIPLQSWGQDLGIEYSSDLAVGLFVAYSILMIAIGLIASRYQTDKTEYFVAGRRAGLFVIGISIFAGIQSGLGVIGLPGTTYGAGMQFFVLLFFIPAFYVIPYWLLGKKMRMLGEAKDAITAGDAVFHRFKDERLRLLASSSVFLGCIGYLASQYAALGMVAAFILPLGFTEALLISLAVVGIYTVIGGMLAALWSDAVQGVIMLVGALLTSFYVVTSYPGGWGGAMNDLAQEAPGFQNMALPGTEGGLPLGLFISFWILILTVVGLPHSFTKFYMTKNVTKLKWGALVTGVAYLISALFFLTAPIMRAAVETGQLQAPPTPDATVPLALINFAPDAVVALVLTGIVAAIMSTSNAFLNMGSSAILHDVFEENQGYDLSGSQQVFWGRIITLVILLGAFVIAATFPDLIFTIGAAGWAVFATVMVPGVAIAYNWKGATSEGVLWGGISGLVLTLVFAYGVQYAGLTLPMGFFGGQLAMLIGFVVFVVVSYVTSTSEYNDLKDPEVKAIIDEPRMGASTPTVDQRREKRPTDD